MKLSWLKTVAYHHKRSAGPGGARPQAGMTLVELMVAVAVMTVVTGLLLAFLYDFFDLMRTTSGRLIARQRQVSLIQAMRKDVKNAEAVLAKLASFKTGEGSLVLRIPANLEKESGARYVVYQQKGQEIKRSEFDAGMRVLKTRQFVMGPGLVKMKFRLAPPPTSFFEGKGKARMLLWGEISFRKTAKGGRVSSISFCNLARPYGQESEVK